MSEIVEVSCFKCGKQIKKEYHNNDPTALSAVHNGLIFRTSGNYGSTIFDPITIEEYLEVIICDDCCKVNKESIKHISNIKRSQIVTAEVKPFEI